MNQTELANIALGHIGSALIQSIDEVSPAAQHCRRMWGLTRDSLLRERPWNFALKRASLSKLGTDPPFGYTAAYALPADYILAVEWNGQEAGTGDAQFDIEGNTLLSNTQSTGTAEQAELRYVFRCEQVTAWDASFCRAFTFALAAAIAPSISTSSSLADSLLSKADAVTMKAFGPDNLETRPRVVMAQTNSGWLAAREGYSYQ